MPRIFPALEGSFSACKSKSNHRGDQKWLELCGVITSLANLKYYQNDVASAEARYKESLALHEKHQRSDEAEVAGAQQSLAYLYVRMGRFDDAEPLYRKSVESYETRIKGIEAEGPKAAYGRHLAMGYFALAQNQQLEAPSA